MNVMTSNDDFEALHPRAGTGSAKPGAFASKPQSAPTIQLSSEPAGTPEPDLSQLRSVLNRYRTDAGLTFDALAEASGLSRQTLLNISSGKYHGDIRTWLKLSSAFDVPLDELLADVWASPA